LLIAGKTISSEISAVLPASCNESWYFISHHSWTETALSQRSIPWLTEISQENHSCSEWTNVCQSPCGKSSVVRYGTTLSSPASAIAVLNASIGRIFPRPYSPHFSNISAMSMSIPTTTVCRNSSESSPRRLSIALRNSLWLPSKERNHILPNLDSSLDVSTWWIRNVWHFLERALRCDSADCQNRRSLSFHDAFCSLNKTIRSKIKHYILESTWYWSFVFQTCLISLLHVFTSEC
jgi:hypothetical protein